ncbi:biotin transporter BioY [Alteribacillus sp. YIM 98480]|uniref:biotin transporter BioY n=1 Tax=Alteribacillus sp. YIM 98480 TaxID=2606599 RepID=UPI00131D5C8D|nr:biotin transporter BioY [Alteribacillus sp. YIM 98480]
MKTRNMMYVAMFAAVVGVLGLMPPIPLPFTPVPITAQTLGVMLAGSLLGAKLGGGSMLLFLALIAAGMPILSGGRGGLGVLFGPSGGYILSWPLAAFLIGFMMQKAQPTLNLAKAIIINIVGGIFVIHVFGIIYLAFITNISLWAAAVSSLGFVPGDTVKAIVSATIAVKIAKSHPSLLKGNNKEEQSAKKAG